MQKYTFGRWLSDTILWCIFLSLVVYVIHGSQSAWIGVVVLFAWYLTGGVREAFQKMDTKHKSLIVKVGVFYQLLLMAITQKNARYLFDAEREYRYANEDAEKLHPDEKIPVISVTIHPSMLITAICSIITVIILEYYF